MHTIALLPGDGIGPEIIDETVKILKVVEKRFNLKFQFIEGLAGGVSIDTHGVPLTYWLCVKSVMRFYLEPSEGQNGMTYPRNLGLSKLY